MVRRCRNCGLPERLHTDAGIIYGAACDDFQEGEEREKEYDAEDKDGNPDH
jgi:hypothetical protein